MAKLLITIWRLDELNEALHGGADIIDVKDPSKGSLGLPDLDVVREVVSSVGGLREVSMAIGDLSEYSDSLKYIAYAAALTGVSYVKAGLASGNISKCLLIASEVSKQVNYVSKPRLVLAGYADYSRSGCIEPLEVVRLAKEVKAHGVMIDTLIKDGKSTFNFLSRSYLEEFIEEARKLNLLKAIAGGLRREHIADCIKLGFDVIGIRGAACEGSRVGRVSRELVAELKNVLLTYSGRISV